MRLFAAIRVPEDLRRSLTLCCEEIGRMPALPRKTKWVKEDNIHLTLKFFGEVDETRLKALESAIVQSTRPSKAFSLSVRGIGSFSLKGFPRVLWAGVADPESELSRCAESLETQTIQSGFEPSDKPFSAHLTLARFLSNPRGDFGEILQRESARDFGSMTVDRIHLVESRLSSEGPIYSDLKEFPLGGS